MLEELQEKFYAGIFNPTPESIREACRFIRATPAQSAEELLGIYRGSVLGSITRALMQIYPVCVKLVGEKYFSHMVTGYLRNYPSGSPDLGNYGEQLPAYIAEFKPAAELVYLADVAQLEWLWHQAFNAGNNAETSFRSFAQLAEVASEDQADIQLLLPPSARLLQSPYPVHRIWEVNQDDFSGVTTVDLKAGSIKIIVWRDVEFAMCIDLLDDDDYRLLMAIAEGKSFGEIAALDFSSPLDLVLPRCIQAGFVVGFIPVEREGKKRQCKISTTCNIVL